MPDYEYGNSLVDQHGVKIMQNNPRRETDLYSSKYWDDIITDNGMPTKGDIDYYSNFYRFGLFDPYNEPDSGREFLFFTKPDLYICKSSNQLSDELANYPFFMELIERWPNVIRQLQGNARVFPDDKNPFMFLLSNMVTSSLDLPSLSGKTVETPANIFGISYEYRWTSEASDDNHTFSLEFKDTKNLDVYMLFRAYEEYEILKAQGVVKLYNNSDYIKYIEQRTLHDQIGVYKFIVAEDMETIMHYSYFCGTMFTSLPRESFNDADFHEGIKYGIDMKTAFVEDMNPLILSDFNNLVDSYNSSFSSSNEAPVFNQQIDMADLRAVSSPYIVEGSYNNKKYYKLKWYRKPSLLSTENIN